MELRAQLYVITSATGITKQRLSSRRMSTCIAEFHDGFWIPGNIDCRLSPSSAEPNRCKGTLALDQFGSRKPENLLRRSTDSLSDRKESSLRIRNDEDAELVLSEYAFEISRHGQLEIVLYFFFPHHKPLVSEVELEERQPSQVSEC